MKIWGISPDPTISFFLSDFTSSEISCSWYEFTYDSSATCRRVEFLAWFFTLNISVQPLVSFLLVLSCFVLLCPYFEIVIFPYTSSEVLWDSRVHGVESVGILIWLRSSFLRLIFRFVSWLSFCFLACLRQNFSWTVVQVSMIWLLRESMLSICDFICRLIWIKFLKNVSSKWTPFEFLYLVKLLVILVSLPIVLFAVLSKYLLTSSLVISLYCKVVFVLCICVLSLILFNLHLFWNWFDLHSFLIVILDFFL